MIKGIPLTACGSFVKFGERVQQCEVASLEASESVKVSKFWPFTLVVRSNHQRKHVVTQTSQKLASSHGKCISIHMTCYEVCISRCMADVYKFHALLFVALVPLYGFVVAVWAVRIALTSF